MNLNNTSGKIAFLLAFLLQSYTSFCQDHESLLARQLPKEDQYGFHLNKSKTQKTKAIVALVAGPVLTATGALIASKGGPTISGAGGGWFTVSDTDAKGAIGGSIGVLGILTTLSSIPFFISSSQHKKEAALLIKSESTSLLNRNIPVPGLTLRLSL